MISQSNTKSTQNNQKNNIYNKHNHFLTFTIQSSSQQEDQQQSHQQNESQIKNNINITKIDKLTIFNKKQSYKVQPSLMISKQQKWDYVIQNNQQIQSTKSINHHNNPIIESNNHQNKNYNQSNIFCFDISDSDQQTNPNANYTQQQQYIQQNKQQQSQQKSQQKSQQYQQNIGQSISLQTQQQNQNHTQNLTQINKISKQFATQIASFNEIQKIKKFLFYPIQNQITLQFEVHQYTDFMNKQYKFWLQYDDTMIEIANAKKSIFSIDKTIFNLEISTTDESQNQNLFIGQLISNFKRDYFTLYDHKNDDSSKQNGKVICTVVSGMNYLNPELKYHQLFIPQVLNQKCKEIYHNSLTKNLKKIYKLEQFRQQVCRFSSFSLSTKYIDKLRQEFKVVTNTSRNTMVKDQHGDSRFFLVKMQHGRFKIRCGKGISPIQLFSYAIVHLQ